MIIEGASALMKVWRKNAATDFRLDIAEKANAVQFLEGICDSRKRADLREAGAIYRDGFVGKELNVETGWRIDPDPYSIDTRSVDADVGIDGEMHRFVSCVFQQPQQHQTVGAL
jgi:hypothetical protein